MARSAEAVASGSRPSARRDGPQSTFRLSSIGDALVDWSSFLTGVAVTVVGGLILAFALGAPQWYLRRRRQTAVEAERAYIERIPIQVGPATSLPRSYAQTPT